MALELTSSSAENCYLTVVSREQLAKMTAEETEPTPAMAEILERRRARLARHAD